jgi:hypothetical protein
MFEIRCLRNLYEISCRGSTFSPALGYNIILILIPEA